MLQLCSCFWSAGCPTPNELAPHCKEGIVITTDSLPFQIQMSEHNSLLCGGELHDNLFLIPSQLSSTLSQLTVSMHQIGSLICSKHNKQMVRVAILFLLCSPRPCIILNSSQIPQIVFMLPRITIPAFARYISA